MSNCSNWVNKAASNGVGALTALALAAASFVWMQSGAAAQSEPIWLDELKAQIYQDETCDANYFLNVHEYELGKDKVYEAKVQCVDGRQFDATRTGTYAKFVIRTCQPVVC